MKFDLDCRNGFHRYSGPHAINSDRKRWMRTCRKCAEVVISWFDEENSRIVEEVQRRDDNTGTLDGSSTNQHES